MLIIDVIKNASKWVTLDEIVFVYWYCKDRLSISSILWPLIFREPFWSIIWDEFSLLSIIHRSVHPISLWSTSLWSCNLGLPHSVFIDYVLFVLILDFHARTSPPQNDEAYKKNDSEGDQNDCTSNYNQRNNSRPSFTFYIKCQWTVTTWTWWWGFCYWFKLTIFQTIYRVFVALAETTFLPLTKKDIVGHRHDVFNVVTGFVWTESAHDKQVRLVFGYYNWAISFFLWNVLYGLIIGCVVRCVVRCAVRCSVRCRVWIATAVGRRPIWRISTTIVRRPIWRIASCVWVRTARAIRSTIVIIGRALIVSAICGGLIVVIVVVIRRLICWLVIGGSRIIFVIIIIHIWGAITIVIVVIIFTRISSATWGATSSATWGSTLLLFFRFVVPIVAISLRLYCRVFCSLHAIISNHLVVFMVCTSTKWPIALGRKFNRDLFNYEVSCSIRTEQTFGLDLIAHAEISAFFCHIFIYNFFNVSTLRVGSK